jgi:hypothetical protein
VGRCTKFPYPTMKWLPGAVGPPPECLLGDRSCLRLCALGEGSSDSSDLLSALSRVVCAGPAPGRLLAGARLAGASCAAGRYRGEGGKCERAVLLEVFAPQGIASPRLASPAISPLHLDSCRTRCTKVCQASGRGRSTPATRHPLHRKDRLSRTSLGKHFRAAGAEWPVARPSAAGATPAIPVSP